MNSRSLNIQLVLDANNVHAQAEWWANALGWVVAYPACLLYTSDAADD